MGNNFECSCTEFKFFSLDSIAQAVSFCKQIFGKYVRKICSNMLTNTRSSDIIHSCRTNVSNRLSPDRKGNVIRRDIMTAERTRYMYSKVYMEPDRYYKPERRTSRKRISRAERIARRRRERMKKMAAFFLTLIIMNSRQLQPTRIRRHRVRNIIENTRLRKVIRSGALPRMKWVRAGAISVNMSTKLKC